MKKRLGGGMVLLLVLSLMFVICLPFTEKTVLATGNLTPIFDYDFVNTPMPTSNGLAFSKIGEVVAGEDGAILNQTNALVLRDVDGKDISDVLKDFTLSFTVRNDAPNESGGKRFVASGIWGDQAGLTFVYEKHALGMLVHAVLGGATPSADGDTWWKYYFILENPQDFHTFTLSVSSTNKLAVVYVDGEKKLDIPSESGFVFQNSKFDFALGAIADFDRQWYTEGAKCTIKHLSFYQTAVTAAMAKTLYAGSSVQISGENISAIAKLSKVKVPIGSGDDVAFLLPKRVLVTTSKGDKSVEIYWHTYDQVSKIAYGALCGLGGLSNGLGLTVSVEVEESADMKEICRPAPIFTDNMVLQRGQPVRIFGTAGDGKVVTVAFNGQTKTATAVDQKWEVILDCMTANSASQMLVITSDAKERYEFSNVVIGEVWLCSGQSNMEFQISQLAGNYADYQSFTNFDKIRVMAQPYAESNIPKADSVPVSWLLPKSLEELKSSSAFAVGYALALQKELNVPVGIVTSSVGGSCIEEWLDKETVNKTGSIASTMGKVDSRFYNAMIHPFAGYTFKGILWYQGEANCTSPSLYKTQFKGYAELYRKLFHDANLPILFAQLPKFQENYWPAFRQAQWELMSEMENVYAVCGIDLGNPNDIHPTDKKAFSGRASRLAANVIYGISGAGLSASPVKIVMEKGKLVVQFEGVTLSHTGSEISEFEVAGSDGQYKTATAEIEQGNIVLASSVKEPFSVRYAYRAVPNVTLFDEYGLPVAPFVMSVSAQEYKVAVLPSVHGEVQALSPLIVTSGSVVRFKLVPESGYQVSAVKWNGKPVYVSGGMVVSPMVMSDCVLEVVFTKIVAGTKYTIQSSVAGEGRVSAPQTVENGQSVLIGFIANEGYQLDSVKINGQVVVVTGSSYTIANVTKNIEIEVVFKKIADTSGGGCGNKASGVVLLVFGLALVGCKRIFH